MAVFFICTDDHLHLGESLFVIHAGDIFAVKNTGWASDLVTWGSGGEVSHVGLVICTEPTTLVMEAVHEVRTVPIRMAIMAHPVVYLLKALDLTDEQRRLIVECACLFTCKNYGWSTAALRGINWLVESRIFDAMIRWSDAVHCDWFVSEAYRAAGLDFGVEKEKISPQVILDFARAHPQKYQVLKLRDDEE